MRPERTRGAVRRRRQDVEAVGREEGGPKDAWRRVVSTMTQKGSPIMLDDASGGGVGVFQKKTVGHLTGLYFGQEPSLAR